MNYEIRDANGNILDPNNLPFDQPIFVRPRKPARDPISLWEADGDPQCDEVADIDYEVNAQIRCKLEAGHKGDCEPEG